MTETLFDIEETPMSELKPFQAWRKHSLGFTGTQIGLTVSQSRNLEMQLYSFKQRGYVRAHHGDCIGADAEFHKIAKYLGFDIIIHPPIDPIKRAWCEAEIILPKKSYLDRNHDIVRCTSLLLATPKEPYEVIRSGTWATIRYAQKHGVRVVRIDP